MEVGYCHNCKFYDDENYICLNDKAFKINHSKIAKPEFPGNLRDRDGGSVNINVDDENIIISVNFGCVHFEEKTDEIDNFEDNMNY